MPLCSKQRAFFSSEREAFHWAYGVKQATNDDWAGYASKEGILLESKPPKTRKALVYTVADALKQSQRNYDNFMLGKIVHEQRQCIPALGEGIQTSLWKRRQPWNLCLPRWGRRCQGRRCQHDQSNGFMPLPHDSTCQSRTYGSLYGTVYYTTGGVSHQSERWTRKPPKGVSDAARARCEPEQPHRRIILPGTSSDSLGYRTHAPKRITHYPTYCLLIASGAWDFFLPFRPYLHQ